MVRVGGATGGGCRIQPAGYLSRIGIGTFACSARRDFARLSDGFFARVTRGRTSRGTCAGGNGLVRRRAHGQRRGTSADGGPLRRGRTIAADVGAEMAAGPVPGSERAAHVVHGRVGDFRRSGNFDFVLGLAYQSLSPNAGNWLGKGNDPSTDTDYVQFDGLASWTFDAAFILHNEFSENFGMHYGGGVGIGIVSGQMLRTSNGSPGCATSPGDPTKCFPIACPQGPCTEAQLLATEGSSDSSTMPSRHADGRVPTVYPIVNLVVGLDVRLPNVPGMAMKFEVGYFFPFFFFGPSVVYQI